MNRRAQRGLTLPELLIALLVFAMISSVGVYLLRLTVDGRDQLLRADQNLRNWQIARLIIRQDLGQIVQRAARDEFGEPAEGPFLGGLGFSGRTPVRGETPLVAFVRGGYANPAGEPRPDLQYVEYILKGDDIVRRTRPYLDDARNQPDRDRVLYPHVEDVEVTFLLGETSRGLHWIEDWPGPGGGDQPPEAVRLTMVDPRFGAVEQLFWIGDVGLRGGSGE